MKPPKCSLCKKNSRSDPEERFKLLYFKLTPAQTDRHSEIVNAGKVGHKPGAHWFSESLQNCDTAYTLMPILPAISFEMSSIYQHFGIDIMAHLNCNDFNVDRLAFKD